MISLGDLPIMPPIDPLGTFLCAGASAVTAEAVWGCPVNTCKIQLQQQTGAVGQSGMLSAARRVASQSGGPRGLWQGLAPALWRQVVYGQLRIGLYNALASRMEERGGTVGSSLSGKVALGAASGCGSALLANPFDLAMVRIQSEAHLPPRTAPVRWQHLRGASAARLTLAGVMRQTSMRTCWLRMFLSCRVMTCPASMLTTAVVGVSMIGEELGAIRAGVRCTADQRNGFVTLRLHRPV